MTDLTFASPIWFWGLLLLPPLIALRIWAHLSTAKQLPGLVSPRLQRQLISGNSHALRWAVFVLQCVALAATFAALARPRLGFEEVEAQTDARNLIIAIDTSRSMLANDLKPNRLERAKLAAMDIVRALPEDRIGLIAFAGRPFLQAPLTVDHEAILESIYQLDTEIIPRGGTNLTAAATLALETFEEAELEQSALVIFSDGEALEGLEEAEALQEKAKTAGMSILTVGVGTSAGAIIPEIDERGDPIPGVFVKDESGQVVRSRLDSGALQALARDGGAYVHLGGKASLTQVVIQIQSGIATSREESDASLRPIERFIWPLSLAVACLILAHTVPLLWLKPGSRSEAGLPVLSSAAKAAILLLALGSTSVIAEDALFVGHESFEKDDYEGALRAFEGALASYPSKKDATRLQMGIGASAFRQGDYERAAIAYGEALVESSPTFREHAHYNLGNTLYRQGESSLSSMEKPANPDELQTLSAPSEIVEQTIKRWESAIEHYESALSLNQKNERAAHNIEVVKKRIEELKKQQEEQKKEEEQKQEDQEKEDEEKEEDQEKDEEKKDQEQSEEEKDKNKDPSESEQEKEDESEKGDSGDEPENEDKQEEQDSEKGENPDEPKEDSEDPEDPSEEEGDEEKEGDQKKPEGNEPQPEEPSTKPPEDGKLEANPNESQPAQPQETNPGEMKRNPETGYSPSEARQLLDALADETEVRPILKPSRGENFKNW